MHNNIIMYADDGEVTATKKCNINECINLHIECVALLRHAVNISMLLSRIYSEELHKSKKKKSFSFTCRNLLLNVNIKKK